MENKKLSIILIDWNVRESFHSVEYLNHQTVDRESYELIWVEYYNHRPQKLREYYEMGYIDKWIVLGNEGMYFKHQCYNEGIAASEGDIISICDSDAIFTKRYVEEVLLTFDKHSGEDIVLYLDQVRNDNPVFYPFKYVSIETIMETPGLINWDEQAKKTVGLTTNHDPIHYRNYGASLSMKRSDVIKAGGYDEHETYHCFMCGPYELGWRLLNKGFKELWHENEWLYHVWHPWIKDGVDIYGPHDGRGLNATALEAWKTGRFIPLKENPKITDLRIREYPEEQVFNKKLDSSYLFKVSELRNPPYEVFSEPEPNFIVNKALVVMEQSADKHDLNRILRHTGLIRNFEIYHYDIEYHKYGQEKMEERLLTVCSYFQPEIIIYIPLKNRDALFVHESVEPRKDVIEKLASTSRLYVHGLSSQNDVEEWMPYANSIGIYSRAVYEKYQSSNRATFVYPDINLCRFAKIPSNKDIDVLFCGSLPEGSKRQQMVQYLKDNGVNVHTRLHRLLEKDYIELLNSSKICINFCDEPSIVPRRALEIMACGTLLINEQDELLDEMFNSNEDFISFDDESDLLKKIRYYLAHDQERRSIALSGHRKMTKNYNSVSMWGQTLAASGYSTVVGSERYRSGQKVAIFGAGLSGEAVYKQLLSDKVIITGFLDNFPPESKKYLNLPVYKPQEMIANYMDEVDTIVLASAGRKIDMLLQLLDMGYRKNIMM